MRIAKLFALVFILAGCAGLKQNAVFVHEGKLKNFETDSERALIYVFRDKAFLGKNATSQLVVNDVANVTIDPGQFSVVSVAPGKYEFLAASSNETNVASMVIHNKKKDPVVVTAQAGQIYYLETEFHALSGFSLKAVPAEEIQPKIKKAAFNKFERL